MNRALPALVLSLACAAIATVAVAQVYRWVDKDGKVHYSDKKPPDAPAKDMHIDSAPSDPEAAEKAMAELKANAQGLDQDDALRKEKEAVEARAAAQREQGCKDARAKLEMLMRVNLTFTTDANGNQVYEDAAKLDSRRADARRKVAESCG